MCNFKKIGIILSMIIKYEDQDLVFTEVKLYFDDGIFSDVFAIKNNRTLLETINSEKYKKFKLEVIDKYSNFLDWPLGKFIHRLKVENDNFYLKFLNKYGDRAYCHFEIKDKFYLNKKGLYIYYINSDIKYIGRCLNTFKNRVNHQGYGKIHPKNCYIDGQATNCHLNYLITQIKDKIKFAVLILNNENEIKTLEKEFIAFYRPEWNLRL